MQTNTFLGIRLAPNIKARHMLSYLLIALITSGYAGGLAILQPGVLELLGVAHQGQGAVTAGLQLTQEALFIFLTGIFGVLSERFGRRWIYVIGLVVSAVGYALYPHAENITQLFFFRFFYAIGGAAILAMLVAVIADYASDEHRGKANGLQGLLVTLGAFIPIILSQLPAHYQSQGLSQAEAMNSTFHTAALLGIFAALIAWIGLAKLKPAAREDRTPFKQIAKEGIFAAKSPGVALSYGAAFISRGDLAVTGAFMMLWGQQYVLETIPNSTISQAQKMTGAEVMGMTVLGALCGAILMTVISDRIRRVTAVTLSAGLASLVYIGIWTLDNPFSSYGKILLFLMGVAELCAFISSQVLAAEQAPANRRGAVTGFFGAAGALGMLVATGLGGILSKTIGPSAPFIGFGFFNLAVFIWSLAVFKKIKTPEVLLPL